MCLICARVRIIQRSNTRIIVFGNSQPCVEIAIQGALYGWRCVMVRAPPVLKTATSNTPKQCDPPMSAQPCNLDGCIYITHPFTYATVPLHSSNPAAHRMEVCGGEGPGLFNWPSRNRNDSAGITTARTLERLSS